MPRRKRSFMAGNQTASSAHAVVRIPKTLDQRLTRLAERTGRSKAYYAKRALEIYIEDLEDTLLAQAALAGSRERISLEEVLAKHGVADRADTRGRAPALRPLGNAERRQILKFLQKLKSR